MLVHRKDRCANMEEKLVNIMNEMAEYLNISQLKKLQEVLLKHLSDNAPQKESVANADYLKLFLDAKKIEGLFRANDQVLPNDSRASTLAYFHANKENHYR